VAPKKLKKLKGKLYEICVVQSTLHSVHGFTSALKEVYVPEYNLSFNSGFGENEFNCFNPSPDRYKASRVIKEVDIPEHIESILKKYVDRQKDVDNIHAWFNDIAEEGD